jgi:hypothetical protein
MSKVGMDPTSVKKLSEKAANEPTRFNATERSAFIKDSVLKIGKMLQVQLVYARKYVQELVQAVVPKEVLAEAKKVQFF